MSLGSVAGVIPVTVGDLLLGRPHDPDGPVEAERRGLVKALRESRALPAVTAASGPDGVVTALDSAVAQLEDRLREALAAPLTEVLLRELAGSDRLITACDAVAVGPGSEVAGREPVRLVDCGWLVEYGPRLTLRLEGAPALDLPVEVELIFRVPELTAVVEQDRVTGLRAPTVEIGGKLWLATEPVSERAVTMAMHVSLTPDLAPALNRQQIDLRAREIRLPDPAPDDDEDDYPDAGFG